MVLFIWHANVGKLVQLGKEVHVNCLVLLQFHVYLDGLHMQLYTKIVLVFDMCFVNGWLVIWNKCGILLSLYPGSLYIFHISRILYSKVSEESVCIIADIIWW